MYADGRKNVRSIQARMFQRLLTDVETEEYLKIRLWTLSYE